MNLWILSVHAIDFASNVHNSKKEGNVAVDLLRVES